MKYFLLVKKSRDNIHELVEKWLPYAEIYNTKPVPKEDVGVYVYASTDLTMDLNTWFISDRHESAPYPDGSLLWWTPITDPITEE